MESFKERMRRIRLRAGFKSQAAAAKAIGCERGTVSMWEAPSSEVKKVGSEWLFQTARAYKVRPEWINDPRSRDDGYPWNMTGSESGARASQPTGPDPRILHEAVTLFMFDLDHGGPRTAHSASDLLMDLYRRIEARGGRLSEEEERAFEEAARQRGKQGESDGADAVRRARRRGR